MLLRWAEGKAQSEKKKLKADSSKSKVLIDFIGVGMWAKSKAHGAERMGRRI